MDYYNGILDKSFHSAAYKGSCFIYGWVFLSDGGHEIPEWKFHVSVREPDVPDAWNIIADYLVNKDDHFKAKAAGPSLRDMFNNPKHRQAGKMIVLYATKNATPEQWHEIVKDLERLLREHRIEPGHKVKNDRPVPGSLYFSYRHDGGASPVSRMEIRSAEPEKRYNPRSAHDPFFFLGVG